MTKVRENQVNELLKAIKSKLKTIHPRIYFQGADPEAGYPYLVYDCQVHDDGEGTQFVNLDIDGWDKSQYTSVLNSLMENVNNGINKQVISTDKISVVFYLEDKLSIKDDLPKFKRRKYIYVGKLFKRS